MFVLFSATWVGWIWAILIWNVASFPRNRAPFTEGFKASEDFSYFLNFLFCYVYKVEA
jgi:hypothetical protein